LLLFIGGISLFFTLVPAEVRGNIDGVAVIDGGWRDGGPSGHRVLQFLGVSGTVDVSGVEIFGGQAPQGTAIGVGDSSADVTVSDSFLHENRGVGAIGRFGATAGSLTVRDSELVDNSIAVGQFGGGGIHVANGNAPVRIERTTFTGNHAYEGGGLYLDTADGTANVVLDSVFASNSSVFEGGAIHVAGGDLTISGSTFTGNHTNHSGGALYLDSGDTVIVDSSFTGNTADERAGAIFLSWTAESSLTVRRTTIADNEAATNGGGIAAKAAVTVEESTISGNVAGGDGGGIYVFYELPYSVGTLVVVNSTISGNEAGGTGGAVLADAGGTVLVADTITGNVANGVDGIDGVAVETVGVLSVAADPVPVAGAVRIVGTILAGNGTSDLGRASGPVDPTVTADHSLIGTSGVPVTNLGGSRTGVGAAALQLGPLADNGGPTLTHALLAGSPALDAGPASWPPFEGDAYDQRGTPYVRVYNGTVDVGAYEEQPRPQPTPEPGPEPEPTFTG
ncbi:MAG: right-handed parallel beta-helix repeat-containing protein, partial [Actinomycetes bacterium]